MSTYIESNNRRLYKITAPKRIESIINNYNYSRTKYGYRNIWQAYKTCSYAKEKAYHYCEELCYAFDGYGLTVVSTNCFKFTVSFEFLHPVNGNVCLAYITDNGDYYVEV